MRIDWIFKKGAHQDKYIYHFLQEINNNGKIEIMKNRSIEIMVEFLYT